MKLKNKIVAVPANGGSKLAALPREYEPRFESNKKLTAFIDQSELLRRLKINLVETETNKLAPSDNDRFLTEKEILTRVRCCRRTLTRWKQKKLIPHIKIGRRVLYSWDDVSRSLKRLTIFGGDL
jgi:hypothetical protein